MTGVGGDDVVRLARRPSEAQRLAGNPHLARLDVNGARHFEEAPVSTFAPGSSSKPWPRGRSPLTQIAASLDCSTKSHRERFSALGRSPNRLRPRKRPVTVTPRSAKRAGVMTMPRTVGVLESVASMRLAPSTHEHLVAIGPASAADRFEHRLEVVGGEARIVFTETPEVPELAADFAVAAGGRLAPVNEHRMHARRAGRGGWRRRIGRPPAGCRRAPGPRRDRKATCRPWKNDGFREQRLDRRGDPAGLLGRRSTRRSDRRRGRG